MAEQQVWEADKTVELWRHCAVRRGMADRDRMAAVLLITSAHMRDQGTLLGPRAPAGSRSLSLLEAYRTRGSTTASILPEGRVALLEGSVALPDGIPDLDRGSVLREE